MDGALAGEAHEVPNGPPAQGHLRVADQGASPRWVGF
jgi:hypothetical protein